ncbi:hypothetical protein [Mammaliicoccus sp. F-M27]|uniref:hypothetical protein n=1 Tax=Mammaliicoccus sp. F-M27 TaxID=2898687 RepID=UPI001EFA9098|nr:hypothetical protein [Mammaliicoccus sp. F-M27]
MVSISVKELAVDMARYYSEEKLVDRLIESESEILQEAGEQILNEQGYPDWVRLRDVRYIVRLFTHYSFEDWAELAKALFHIENVTTFVKEDMYQLFLECIELFDINLYIETDKEELEEGY